MLSKSLQRCDTAKIRLIGPRYYSFKVLKCCVSSVVVTLRAIFGGESWLTDIPRSKL